MNAPIISNDSHSIVSEEQFSRIIRAHQNEVSSFQATEATASDPAKASKAQRKAALSELSAGAPANATSSATIGKSNATDPDLFLSDPVAYLKQESELGGEGGQSLIAIIGYALTLQVKENSQFYSTLFQQATMSMNTAVAFAPLIYNNVVDKYNNQADQTQTEANSAKWQAIVQFSTAAILVGLGAVEAFKKPPGEDPELKATNQTQNDVESDLSANRSTADRTATEESNNIGSKVDEELNTVGKVGRKLSSIGGAATSKFKTLIEVLDSATKKSQFMGIFSNGACQAIDSNYKNQATTYIKQAGSADATAQEMEQFAQYYNQSFSRNEDLRGGSQNNVDTATQILKSISDSMTQTTQSMFRG